jgi:hypothetical protein
MNRKLLISFIFCLTGLLSLSAKGYSPHMINLFFENYPLLNTTTEQKQASTKNPRSGIFVAYFGYIATSDKTGQVSFPRKHQKPSFSLLICRDITPIFMFKNTIHHWQIKHGSKASFYSIERQQDPTSKLYFWNIAKETIPENNHLPVNTIVVFANPEDVYVPEGISMTNKNPQLLLPSLYAKNSIEKPENALAAIEIRTFFDPIMRTYKTEKADVVSQTNQN